MQNNVEKKLRDIAEVVSGYTFRDRIEVNPIGPSTVLLSKNIQKNHMYIDTLTRTSLEAPTHCYLKKGDVIFKSKGADHVCVYVEQDLNQIIAAAPLMLIRLSQNEKTIQAKFLAHFLNSRSAQKYFDQVAGNTTIKHVSKAALLNLSIPCLSIKVQGKIVELFELYEYEKKLQEKLQDHKEKIIDKVMDEWIFDRQGTRR